MAVFRIERTKDYTVMSNHHLRNHELSLKAKGLLSMMLSLPDDWNYTTRGLAKICKEGVDAIGSALRELETAGYIVRNQLRDQQGRISDTEYVIYEKPQPRQPERKSKDNRYTNINMKSIYFIGAGGIGMSALERYYNKKGYKVGGYDKTPSALTDALIKEGIDIHFEDNIDSVAECFKNPEETIVCYTPAIPDSHGELTFFRQNGFKVMKRAQILGLLTRDHHGLCFAGTHSRKSLTVSFSIIANPPEVFCFYFSLFAA